MHGTREQFTLTFRLEVRGTSSAHQIRRRQDPCLRGRTSYCSTSEARWSSLYRRWPSPGERGAGEGPAQLAMCCRSGVSATITCPLWSHQFLLHQLSSQSDANMQCTLGPYQPGQHALDCKFECMDDLSFGLGSIRSTSA